MQDEAKLTKHSYALRYIIKQEQEQQKSNKGRRNGKEVDKH